MKKTTTTVDYSALSKASLIQMKFHWDDAYQRYWNAIVFKMIDIDKE